MKIQLQFPYNVDWRFGYLVTNPEQRKTVILFNSKKERSSTLYSRYVMAVHLKRYLFEDENVDHIDNDKTNDNIENLQILSKSENNKKEGKNRGKLYVELECPICKKIFYRRHGNTQLVPSKKNKICFCSKTCQYIFNKTPISESEREIVSKLNIKRIINYYDICQ